MWFLVVACVVPAFLIAFVATAAMRWLSPRLGLMDQPAARKVHLTPTPLGGGVGIWLGVVVPVAIAQALAWAALQHSVLRSWIPPEVARHLEGVLYRSGQMWAILGGGTLLSLMGLLDDRHNLPWQPRFLIQILVACGLVAAGVRATVLVSAPWFGAGLTVVWILVLTNAFNFLDNMDALSAGIALIAATLFAIVMLTGTSEPRWLVGGMLLVLAGALGGFLCHNRPPATIFMGDTGSYFIGLLLACLTVLGTFYDYGPRTGKQVLLAPLCVLAVPLYDFASVLLIRLSQRRSPFHADKSHFSHRLVDLGLSKLAAVATIHLTTLATGLGALLLYHVDGWGGGALVGGMVACLLAIVAILETAGRKKRAAE